MLMMMLAVLVMDVVFVVDGRCRSGLGAYVSDFCCISAPVTTVRERTTNV